MPNKNSRLNAANKRKFDEFYTQLNDIANELKHYKEHFRGKTVLCNCDDPYESNFFKFFALNFNAFGLKKLIATCYDGSPIADTQLVLFEPETPYGKPETKTKVPHKIEITEVPDFNKDGAIDLVDIEMLLKNDKNVLTRLQYNGDFRSKECIELLKKADIVVTNPPFSLFREYVAQLIKYDKKFLIIGNQNAIKHKEIFPLVMANKIWWGITMNGSNRYFQVPNDFEFTEKTCKIENGKKFAFVKAVRWFTNLDYPKRHEKTILYEKYTSDKYPKYDTYDAINVNKVTEIPNDYEGIMGVPITFLGQYNPDEFEIIGEFNHGCDSKFDLAKPTIQGKELFPRIAIRKIK